jgi:DNA-binding transcriptional LysR family regulator
MTLTQLKCFIAVAEALSFTKAAQQLSFVQSAVSSKIAELENELGVELFIRSSKYVRITNIGKQLLRRRL